MSGKKHVAKLAAFALLEREGKILLARRANTGYADGWYQMPSGHVEQDEHASVAAAREAKEEIGIDIAPEDLEFVHTCYRINHQDEAGDFIDFFFRTKKWNGEPMICEEDKCDDLLWVNPHELPENTVPAIRYVLGLIEKGIPYSEVTDEPDWKISTK